MIVITATPHADGLEITARGHAEAGEVGHDPVCAAVSALLFGYAAYVEGDNAILSTPTPAEVRIPGRGGRGSVAREMGEGSLKIRTHRLKGEDVRAWAVIAAGLALIVSAHPTCVCLFDGIRLSDTPLTPDTPDERRTP